MSRAAVQTKTPAKTRAKPRAKPKQPQKKSAQVLDFPKAVQERQGFDGALPVFDHSEALARAMDRAAPHDLPKQARLEAHFDRSLAEFSAVWSAEIAALLHWMGAEAAVIGERMALPSEDVSFETLAHETAHLLQVVQGFGGWDSGEAATEAEAEARVDAPGDVAERLSAEVVALRDTSLDRVSDADPDARDFRAEQQAQKAGSGDRSAEPKKPADGQAKEPVQAQDQAGDQTGDQAKDGEPAPKIESALPPLPAEAEAAKKALEQSTAALAAAATPEAYMAAFKLAPPSLKAKKSATLDQDMAALAGKEADGFAKDQPEFTAELKGDKDAPPAPEPIKPPSAEEPKLEDGAPLPAPEPEIAPTQALGRFEGNDDLTNWRSPFADKVDGKQLAKTLSGVSTKDESVETSPGPSPKVPLKGESDPKRATEAQEKAKGEAKAKEREAAQAVIQGKGPEQVRMQEATEAAKVEIDASKTALDTQPPVEGAQEFLNKDLDSETQALFDAHHGPAMEASLAETETQMTAMVTERDSRRTAETDKARKDLSEAEAKANDDQKRDVGAARQSIQDERQATLNTQAEATSDMEKEAQTKNKEAQAKISDRVKKDEAHIDAKFKEAETKAESKVQSAEKDAEAEKAKAEKEAANKAWYEKAIDFVAEALKALGKVIGKIFDAVRSVVGAILDGVKKLAHAVIDAAAAAIKGMIEAYAAVLKTLVTHVVGAVFPEAAAKLNKFIDDKVEAAKALVDKAAKGLKAAVDFIVDTYKKALEAILSFVEGALNTVLAVAAAALKGDWGEVARLVIEPILKMLGIDKAVFYQFIGKTVDALGKIVDDPLGFLSNLFGAVVGGFKLFGQNILDHLIKGIIGWLTGALGSDLKIPKTWDLMGVLDLARQILGLTMEMIRKIAVRILGEAAVAKIEFFLGYATELLTKGWGALFEKIKSDLGGLFQMVAGEITTFIVEKVVKAGIVWVASLINPAGALAKLVLMIWDLVMWMKDNLKRFVDIITTVVNGMIDIANGKTEPASKAIEKVLGNLLAPAIDLLARLLGLGNVAGRVKQIIEKVRKTIEDAIVKLIRKVLAKFTGKGGGKGKKDDKTKAKGGALMAPKKFKGAGETHTLYLETQGKGVVPMMRSAPTPVVTWLRSLRVPANVEPYVARMQPGLKGEALKEAARVRSQTLTKHLTAAEKEVADLDREGDQAQAASAKSKAKETADVSKEAVQTISALEIVLNALGIADGGNLVADFAAEIAKLDPVLQGVVKTKLFPNLQKDKPILAKLQTMTKDWSKARATILASPQVWPDVMGKPLHKSGFLRGNDSFEGPLFIKAKALMQGKEAEFNNKTYQVLFADKDAKSDFITHYLLKVLSGTGYEKRFVTAALSPGAFDFGGFVNDGGFTAKLTEALKALATKSAGGGTQPDIKFKEAVAGSPFKVGGIFETGDYKTKTMKHYSVQTPDGKVGPNAKEKTLKLVEFMDKAHTARFQDNITHMANRIRAADKGKHEWIPSSMAVKAMNATIGLLGTDPHKFGTAAQGFADLVYFQHKVRTDTSFIVFSPKWIKDTGKLTQLAPYVSKAHVKWTKDNPGAVPDKTAWSTLYPQNKFYKDIRVFQGHSGGIYFGSFEKTGGKTIKPEPKFKESQRASSAWHGNASSKDGVFGIALDLFSGAVTEKTMQTFAKETVKYFNTSVLNKASEAADVQNTGSGTPFEIYKFSTGGETSKPFAGLLTDLIATSDAAEDKLRKDITAVIGAF
ncbi:phage tail protein [Pacificoceanicola onchidii]|uniref:phage tail protein n=1 Tax=Pacificoceanicola onchidii TaxID=2562685 RepID=UPI0010A50C96|nr:hypothetical protein [Pacificoceanicola onchidii]